MEFAATSALAAVLPVANSTSAFGLTVSPKCQIGETAVGVHVTSRDGVIDQEILWPNLLRIDVEKTGPRTLAMDPNLKVSDVTPVSVHRNGDSVQIRSSEISGSVTTIRIPAQQALRIELR